VAQQIAALAGRPDAPPALVTVVTGGYVSIEPEAGEGALQRALGFYRDTVKSWLDQALGEYQPHPDALRRGDSFAADEWTRAANWAEGQSSTAQGTVD
jgi:hypothetical protein